MNKSFIEEYNYLRDRRGDEENIFEFCIGLPHFHSPSVLSRTSNKTYKNGTPFVCRHTNWQGRNRRVCHIQSI